MQLLASRDAGLRRLDAFVPQMRRYAGDRGFDRPLHKNVSQLSVYLKHRLILESEAVGAALRHYPVRQVEKFLQEVIWRTYWKGWLEWHPGVWEQYLKTVDKDQHHIGGSQRVDWEAATRGETNIDCFNHWVQELLDTGYLHNHARMWFASIWIYTLQLPWQLGADFFYRHLVDGDPAPNTLSWRWVCGLHTKGKTYLADESNIATFSDRRFEPQGELASSAPPLQDSRTYTIRPLQPTQLLRPGERFGLLITEEDCFPESAVDSETPVAVLGALATDLRSPLPVGRLAREFAAGAVADALDRTTQAWGVDGQLSDTDDWGNLLIEWAASRNLSSIATPYAPVGPVAELLRSAEQKLSRHGIKLLLLRRTYDSLTWPHARRGYFKLKQQIPGLLESLDIAEFDKDRVANAI